MVEIFVTEEFEMRYKELTLAIRRKAEKQENFFKENPFYPSLHTEKLEPKSREVWSFRIDKNHRVLFRFIGANKALFLTVGSHNWIYKIQF